MGTYIDYGVFAAAGIGLVWLLRVVWRSTRRNRRTDVSPVSEQWLAERRGKRD